MHASVAILAQASRRAVSKRQVTAVLTVPVPFAVAMADRAAAQLVQIRLSSLDGEVTRIWEVLSADMSHAEEAAFRRGDDGLEAVHAYAQDVEQMVCDHSRDADAKIAAVQRRLDALEARVASMEARLASAVEARLALVEARLATCEGDVAGILMKMD